MKFSNKELNVISEALIVQLDTNIDAYSTDDSLGCLEKVSEILSVLKQIPSFTEKKDVLGGDEKVIASSEFEYIEKRMKSTGYKELLELL